MGRTRIKICGVTREQDAARAAELGADFVGLNFWPGSRRCLEVALARRIAARVRGQVQLVGVFVNQSGGEVREISRQVGLDLVQFHGDETPDHVGAFGDRAIRAFRVGVDFDPSVIHDFPEVWGYLFDCDHPTLLGGTGVSWPYERVVGLSDDKPVIVAGGLRRSNVLQAVARSGADIVDVCSGIESQPGIKDPELMKRFIREVHHAEEE
jgi:phosphoribosylanthranilate isomerase